MTSARSQLDADCTAKIVTLNHNFGGMLMGDLMFVATPRIVADYICAIPYGHSRTIPELREDLAAARSCHGTCPASTAIFIKIAAEVALEDMHAGQSPSEVIPFWRVLTSKDKIAKKLRVDGAWIDHQRMQEGSLGLH